MKVPENKKTAGDYYEQKACCYLEQKGYTIRSRNYRVGHKEIDIIAEKGGVCAFIEVKYREKHKDFDPYASINYKKIQNIKTCAAHYAQKHGLYNTHYCRFDAIVIIKEKGMLDDPGINHIPNAFK